MGAIDTLENILKQESLINANFKFCLVDENKVPYTITNEKLHLNDLKEFVDLETLFSAKCLDIYAGVGVSIQASKITAIDIDKCFKKPFDLSSGDDRATDIIKMFDPYTYIEFSFSGTGLRIFFKNEPILDYAKNYYVKNPRNGCEFYRAEGSYKYVTITGKAIVTKNVGLVPNETIFNFLMKYMPRPKRIAKPKENVEKQENVELLKQRLKYYYFADGNFQDTWFTHAPGSGKDESERDFYLISFIYNNITQDKEQIKMLFELSPFFKSKDKKHMKKWEYNDYRYYNYIYDMVSCK